MTHQEIKNTCESLGMTVRQDKCDSKYGTAWIASKQGYQVQWRLTTLGNLLKKPTLVINGRQTWARTLDAIRWHHDNEWNKR